MNNFDSKMLHANSQGLKKSVGKNKFRKIVNF